MDRFSTLDLFVRIVDRGSFSAAAADLSISRPVATTAIKDLEQRLGGCGSRRQWRGRRAAAR